MLKKPDMLDFFDFLIKKLQKTPLWKWQKTGITTKDIHGNKIKVIHFKKPEQEK